MSRIITEELLKQFQKRLEEDEHAQNTVEKYLRDVRKLKNYADGQELTVETVLRYKESLKKQDYKISSVNSFLVAANIFFEYAGWKDLEVKLFKCQRDCFADEKRELTKPEYLRLIQTARRLKKYRIGLIMTVLGATGIRISELPFLTAQSVSKGKMVVSNKGKTRVVLLERNLCVQLRLYMARQHITSGIVFRTSEGNPLDRSNIWKEMKALCKAAGVEESKVFPHNFRHLFARLYYLIDKDIAELADILGHGSIETTRIYLRNCENHCMEKLKKMDIVVTLFEEGKSAT